MKNLKKTKTLADRGKFFKELKEDRLIKKALSKLKIDSKDLINILKFLYGDFIKNDMEKIILSLGFQKTAEKFDVAGTILILIFKTLGEETTEI